MKTVLLSTQSKWCEKIANEEKPIEVRKGSPKEVPFKVLLYCTKRKPYLHRIDDDKFVIENNKQENDDDYKKFYGDYNGNVIGEFVCDKVEEIEPYEFFTGEDYDLIYEDEILRKSCLTDTELEDYLYSKDGKGYAWYISDLKIYDKPRELSKFGITRAPQSWVYVKGE